MTTQPQNQERLPLTERINIRGEVKDFLARAVKELARGEIRAALQAKGFDDIRFDTAENLKVYITVATTDHRASDRTFVISVREIQ